MKGEKGAVSLSSPSQASSDTDLAHHDGDHSKLLRKVDRNLLPVLTLLYLLSFLDRSNIGNARLDGLTADLGVKGSNYNVSLMLFFLGYVLFEVPSQWALKLLNPQIWLPSLALVWGIVSVCQGLVHNQTGLFVVRFFLGVSECGLFPGCVYVFSLYYPRHLRHFRVALFFSGAALAGAFGGILAYGLGEMRGIGGKNGWSWIFIIEGLLTIVVSIIAYAFIPASLEKARFLSTEEKTELSALLKQDSDAADTEHFNWRGVKSALCDPQCWEYAALFHCHSFSLYSITLFIPTIIASLGFATWKSQLMSTPPYALAFIVTMSVAYFSHKLKRRAPFIIAFDFIAIIGYILLISDTRPGPSYVGLFLVISGIYASNALVLSWPAENVSSQTKRATALGMQISIGNLGAITSVIIYRPTPAHFAAHHYRLPHIITLGYLVVAICVASSLWYFLGRANKRRDGLAQDSEVALLKGGGFAAVPLEERLLHGDRHAAYRYQL